MTDFSEDFQRNVLRLCMTDDGFAMRAFENLRPSYFSTEALGWIFRAQKQYYEANATVLTELVLRHYVRSLSPAQQPLYSTEVEAVIRIGQVREPGFIRSTLKEYVQKNIFTEAFISSQETYNAGKHEDAFEAMRLAMDRIYTLAFEAPNRSWIMEELERREKKRIHNRSEALSNVIPVGIDPLDQRIHGGLHPGQVFAVFAYSKIGKTQWLRWQGYRAALFGHRSVLHVLLEGNREEVEDGYDSSFSGALYSDVRSGHMNNADYKKLYETYLGLKRKLVVTSFTDLDVTADHIVRELKDLEVQGFTPELLVLDYVDLMRSRDLGRLSEGEHQTRAARDLKRLCDARRLACWTAFQAQRPPKDAHTKEHILTASSVADSYSKIRIVDSYGSLNATDDEQKNGIMRLYWEAHRLARMGIVYELGVDIARGQLATTVKERIPKKPEKLSDNAQIFQAHTRLSGEGNGAAN